MRGSKFGWLGSLTVLLIVLLFYRFSHPGKMDVIFGCDRNLKQIFESALNELKISYREVSSGKATLILYNDRAIYRGNVFRFYWNEGLEKEILDVVSFYIKASTDVIESQLREFEQIIRIPRQDGNELLYIVRPQIAEDMQQMIYIILKDILTGKEGIFENGYLKLPLIVEHDGNDVILFDSKSDQVYVLSELGGS